MSLLLTLWELSCQSVLLLCLLLYNDKDVAMQQILASLLADKQYILYKQNKADEHDKK